MPEVVTALGGRFAGMADPPSTTVRKTDGSTRPSRLGTSDTRVHPAAAAAASAAGSNPSCTVRGVPVSSARVTTARPPMWASGRQPSQRSAAGSTPSRADEARADAATASCVSTTALGSPLVPLVATTSASPSVTGSSVRAAASTCARAAGGSRGSSGSTASPSSQARRRRSTTSSVPRASATTRLCTGSRYEAAPRRSTVGAIDATIRTESLTKIYEGPAEGPPEVSQGTRPAVDGLDLEVPRGELFGLLGPNGAGKTTTIGMLTTRVVPTAGRAFVDEIDVVAEPARAKERIGVVTQTNTLDRSLDVRENLEFHARYFGMGGRQARAAADRMLEVVRLTEKATANVNSLSGGMAQRLMVGRAILHRPRVLFLDEPTAGLDPQSRLGLWDTLRELHREGQTVLLTTHYMEEADQLCERVAIMDHGRILALDKPAELKRSVEADTVVTVQADGDDGALAEALRLVEGATGAQAVDGAVRLYVTGGDGVLPRVIAAADRAGHAVRDVHVEEPTLETVFITLTGRELRE